MQREAYKEMADLEGHHWWFVGRRHVIRRTLQRLDAGRPKTKILEIGAGTGGNVQLLREFGSVTAIEFDADARAVASRKTGIEVLHGVLPYDMPRLEQGFDIVCLLDVLEHIDDDRGSLEVASRFLGKTGALLVTVPAAPGLWSAHDTILHHKRRYTRRTLSEVSRRAGLRVERVTYFNTVLYPMAWIARTFNRRRPMGAGMPPSPVNWLFTRILSGEAELLGEMDLPFGLSLLAVLRND